MVLEAWDPLHVLNMGFIARPNGNMHTAGGKGVAGTSTMLEINNYIYEFHRSQIQLHPY